MLLTRVIICEEKVIRRPKKKKKTKLRGYGTLKMRHSSGKGSNFINQWFFAWVAPLKSLRGDFCLIPCLDPALG